MAEDLDSGSSSNRTEKNSEETTSFALEDNVNHEGKSIQDAAEVLGAFDDKVCSYDKGYLKRQAVFSCLTCIPESKDDPEKCAGICLACSYHCHDGHDLIKLDTKRNFRCDCGNKKFSGNKCNLRSDKNDYNELNKYNQNFAGLFCICHRPYPDKENLTEDEMIQCIICEDWYHCAHIEAEIPSEPFAEMICETCVNKHQFLLHYVDLKEDEASSSIDNNCKKPNKKSESAGAIFFQDVSWRKQLCTCDICLQIYKDNNVLFLIDAEDSVESHKAKDNVKTKETFKSHNKNSVNSMNRLQLIEAIAGYKDLKNNLTNYLKKFSENNKVVREEDIAEFFDGLPARKKQKTTK